MELIKVSADTIGDIKESLKAINVEENYLRIHANAGWGGMSFNLVLDEPVDRDLVEEHDGIHFVINDSLYEMYQGFTIDSVKSNGLTYYKIRPGREMDDSGGCASCTSCG